MISFLHLAGSLADQNLESRLEILELKMEAKDREWMQKLEDQEQNFETKMKEKLAMQKLEFDAKLEAMEKSCQTDVHVVSAEYIEERVAKLEEYHDMSFNGKIIFASRNGNLEVLKTSIILQVQAYLYLVVILIFKIRLMSSANDTDVDACPICLSICMVPSGPLLTSP